MDRERVQKYIDVWVQNIRQQDLEELEKDIEMPLTSLLTDILENLYTKYSDTISYIPVNLDSYSNYIIAPKNGKYSLEDFLLNRLLRSTLSVVYSDQSSSFMPCSCYEHDFNEILIDRHRIQTQLTDVRQKRKVVAHEFLHAMKTQFFDGNFYDADIYFQLKEELKSVFGNEINDFNITNEQENSLYKHCGLSYSSIFMKKNLKQYSDIEIINLDEVLNEVDAIEVAKDDYKALAKLAENSYMVLNNPEGSNSFITNYAFIVERLVDKEVLFVGLYIEPETFYKSFNSIYTSIFQKHFNSDLSALDIFTSQLNQIKRNPKSIEEHIKLLNTLYDCIDRRYIIGGFNEQIREANVGCIGNKGLLEIVDGKLRPLEALTYSTEYDEVRKKGVYYK